MFLSSASTRRPIAVTCLLLALIGLGANAFRKMSIENIPAVDIPYVAISTTWPGASPEDTEKDVAKKIEDAVSGVDGLKHVESSCLENYTYTVCEFTLDVDVDVAAQDVREKVDGILSDLPSGAERPVIQKIDINATAIANIFLTGDLPLDQLYDYADNILADRFSSIHGVGKVELIGGNEREIWIELDRDRLAASGLTAQDVATTVAGGILSVPGGRIREADSETSLKFDAEYTDVADIASLNLIARDGARLSVADLGTVRSASEEIRKLATLDGRSGVLLKVVKKGEANVVELVSDLRRRFDELAADLPGGMSLVWVSDEAAFITESYHSTLLSIAQAVGLCALILFFFLANLRTTLIVAITMPVTLAISVYFMQVLGQTFNMVSLLAMGLSTGVLVSNSIVVLESIVSHLETASDPWTAAREGTDEVAVSVLASAGTNVVVMFPIAMMTSMAGRMLKPFAITTLIVNLVSILISFTLTPILSALVLRAAARKAPGPLARFGRRWAASFEAAGHLYADRVLRPIARRRRLSIPIVLLFAAAVWASFHYAGAGLGFNMMEPMDQGRIFIRAEMPTYSNLDATAARLDAIAARLRETLPDLEHVLVSAGKADSMSGQASEGVYMGQIELFFTPKTERAWRIQNKIPEVRDLLSDEPGVRISVSTPSALGGQQFTIEETLSGDDLDTLNAVATSVRDTCASLPGVDFLDTTVRDPKPELRIVPRRAALDDLRLPPAAIGTIIRANVDGIEAATYRHGDRTYDIRVKLAEQPGADQVRQFLLPTPSGRAIPLETVADVQSSRVQPQIYRHDKRRAAVLIGDTAPGASQSIVKQEMYDAIAAARLLPPGYSIGSAGTSEMLGEIVADFLEAILLAIFLTILTLSAILESWTRPAEVLLTLPMALVGILWTLWFFGFNISIMVLLGCLMMIGIVVNPAILIVDQCGRNLAARMSRREAMLAATGQQFRPVLMVFIASALGMLPIALSSGLGSENRAGIGWASTMGIFVAGLLTLLVIPILYNLFTGKPRYRPHD